jgi:hypothetical protein
MVRAKSLLVLLFPVLSLVTGCASVDDEKAHLGEEIYPGIKVGQRYTVQKSNMDNLLETHVCTDIEAFDIHQQVIKDIAQKKLGAVMAEGDIATSGRLLPVLQNDTIGVLYTSDARAKSKELVRVKILSTKMQGTEGKSGWLSRRTLENRSLFLPVL